MPRPRRFSCLIGFAGSVPLSMPLGLMVGTALQPFKAGDLLALLSDDLLQGGDFAKQSNQQSLKLRTAQRGKGGRRRHMMQRIHGAESTQEKIEGRPWFCP